MRGGGEMVRSFVVGIAENFREGRAPISRNNFDGKLLAQSGKELETSAATIYDGINGRDASQVCKYIAID